MSSIDLNFVDTLNIAATSTTGVIYTMAPTTAGYGNSRFLASTIEMIEIQSRIVVAVPDQGVAAPIDDVVRVITFIDTQNNEAIPAVTDVLTSANIMRYQNIDNIARFIFLDDTTFSTPVRTISGSHNAVSYTNKEFRVPVHHIDRVIYDQATSDIVTNAPLQLVISLNGLSTITLSTRLYYKMM